METDALDVTLAERGQIVIPKAARDALGLRPGSKLLIRVDGNRLVVEKKVSLDLSRWVGKAVDDGLTRDQALSELRGRAVPWQTAKPEAKKPGRKAQAVATKT
jgi:AbrB family looped-hinge helix DNA binding protein